MDTLVGNGTLEVGDLRFDRQARKLFRRGATGEWELVALGSRARELLAVLTDKPGEVVSRDTIMDAVWPGVAVEPNNMAVQIAALRRVFDEGRSGESCIQTVTGRGYRFVPPVAPQEEGLAGAGPSDPAANAVAARSYARSWRWLAAVSAAVAVAALLVASTWRGGWLVGQQPPPRLSIVVLPFENLSGNPRDGYLVEGITDDLTTDLSHISGAFVIARESASTYKDKPVDVRKIGEELGVRYVIGGSVRRIASILRVNVHLTSGETGADLWSDRFDEQITELATGQEQIVTRMRIGLGIRMVEIEKARSLRERPTNPDAFDLVLQARALGNRPPNLQRNYEQQALYERALSRDSSSVPALTGVAFLLMDTAYGSWGTTENMQRVESLLIRARAIAPDSEGVLNYTVQWLRRRGRFQEAMAVAEGLIQRFPNNETGYFDLAQSKIYAGHAEEAIPLSEKAIRLNPRSGYLFNRYRDMGFASLMLGRDRDAITFLERSLAINPDNNGYHQWIYRFLAAAYARSGLIPEAKHALAAADRLWPYDTVRMHWPDDPSSPVFAEQIRHFQDALRLAGERDHAEEEEDFGVAADSILHSDFAGLTPTSAPGVTTIRTADLARLLAQTRPIVIDTVSYSWGRSLPEAVGLSNAGLGGSYTDATQDHLRSKLHQLTAGDLSRPVVAVGWNSERFDGRNLALRLTALGYTQVYWYRGGREAWEVNDLPETTLDVQEW
jgi:adenylate cyclase